MPDLALRLAGLAVPFALAGFLSLLSLFADRPQPLVTPATPPVIQEACRAGERCTTYEAGEPSYVHLRHRCLVGEAITGGRARSR